MFYQVFDGPTCFPLPVTLDGYFSSEGTIVTINKTVSLTINNHLYSATNNEVRLVTAIGSDNTFEIESAFTTDVVNDIVYITDTNKTYRSVSIGNYGAADGLLNGEIFFTRTYIDLDFDIPFVIDGTGTEMAIVAQ